MGASTRSTADAGPFGELCSADPADGRFLAPADAPPGLLLVAPLLFGRTTRKPRPRLGSRPPPGVPRPARRSLVVAVQHRVPGGVPGRDELPRLPEPRGRGPLRRGLHPAPGAQSGGRDVLVRLPRPVRAGLPARASMWGMTSGIPEAS